MVNLQQAKQALYKVENVESYYILEEFIKGVERMLKKPDGMKVCALLRKMEERNETAA